MKNIYALIDCNNFYISCERIFAPSLWDRPVVVLSNNDGNIVARSDEVKKMGMPFGAPFFKLKKMIKSHNIAVFSSNYTLYGDISRRVMESLAQFSEDMEVYSIDEAFLSFKGMNRDLTEYGREIKKLVMRWTGVPVSVGIAPTKTLAKLANKISKKNPWLEGVFDITGQADMEQLLNSIKVSDIWGVGQQYTKLLNRNGIFTALHLRDAPDKWIKRNMTIMGLRTAHELRGISCIPLDEAPAPKKGIVSSRSFGKPVESLDELKEALASYTSRGAEKLRSEKGVPSIITVFLTTNPFKDEPQYSNAGTCQLPVPSSHTPMLIACATGLLEKIYKTGYKYKKVGVMLTDIIPETHAQPSLFSPFRENNRDRALMQAVDRINRSMGRKTVHFAAEGIQKPWDMKRQFLSKRFTTDWNEIPVVRA